MRLNDMQHGQKKRNKWKLFYCYNVCLTIKDKRITIFKPNIVLQIMFANFSKEVQNTVNAF